jgi:hypothetical protein
VWIVSRCKVVCIGGTLTPCLCQFAMQLISTKLAGIGFVAQLGQAVLSTDLLRQ